MKSPTQHASNERAAELRALRILLKSGEYTGADIMRAWIACDVPNLRITGASPATN